MLATNAKMRRHKEASWRQWLAPLSGTRTDLGKCLAEYDFPLTLAISTGHPVLRENITTNPTAGSALSTTRTR